jgi:hypothetical protein
VQKDERGGAQPENAIEALHFNEKNILALHPNLTKKRSKHDGLSTFLPKYNIVNSFLQCCLSHLNDRTNIGDKKYYLPATGSSKEEAAE